MSSNIFLRGGRKASLYFLVFFSYIICKSSYKKSLWEKFQDQKDEPWPFTDFNEFKSWYYKQEKIRNESKKKLDSNRSS